MVLDDIFGSECASASPGQIVAGRLDAAPVPGGPPGVPAAAAAVASTVPGLHAHHMVAGRLDAVPVPGGPPGVPVAAADAASTVSAAAAEVGVPPMETREALQQSLEELDSFMSTLSGSRNELDDFDMDSVSVAATLVAAAVVSRVGSSTCLPVQPACDKLVGVCLVARWLPAMLLTMPPALWKSGSPGVGAGLPTKCSIGQTGQRSGHLHHLRSQPPE